jgi:predicted DNA binding CopG/RHH family protein
VTNMRKEYDFSRAKNNPYAKQLKQSVSMRVDRSTLNYFKTLAAEHEVPYQTLINFYLRDCAANGWKPVMTWRLSRSRAP